MLMSPSAAGLQQQLDALVSFCEQQVTVNLTNTKVVVFKARCSLVANYVLNGAVVKRLDSYIGFTIHSTKDLSLGTSCLVAAGKKAMFATQRRCAMPGIRDPAMQCSYLTLL